MRDQPHRFSKKCYDKCITLYKIFKILVIINRLVDQLITCSSSSVIVLYNFGGLVFLG